MKPSISNDEKRIELQILQICLTSLLAFAAFVYVAAPWIEPNDPFRGFVALLVAIALAIFLLVFLRNRYLQ